MILVMKFIWSTSSEVFKTFVVIPQDCNSLAFAYTKFRFIKSCKNILYSTKQAGFTLSCMKSA